MYDIFFNILFSQKKVLLLYSTRDTERNREMKKRKDAFFSESAAIYGHSA